MVRLLPPAFAAVGAWIRAHSGDMARPDVGMNEQVTRYGRSPVLVRHRNLRHDEDQNLVHAAHDSERVDLVD